MIRVLGADGAHTPTLRANPAALTGSKGLACCIGRKRARFRWHSPVFGSLVFTDAGREA
jgi:hypothetical protein